MWIKSKRIKKNSNLMKRMFLIVFTLIITGNSFAVELSLPNVFSDHMLFQRG